MKKIRLFPHWQNAMYYFTKCLTLFCISDTVTALLWNDVHYTHAASSINSIWWWKQTQGLSWWYGIGYNHILNCRKKKAVAKYSNTKRTIFISFLQNQWLYWLSLSFNILFALYPILYFLLYFHYIVDISNLFPISCGNK